MCDRVPSKKEGIFESFFEIHSKLEGIILFLREFKKELRDSFQKWKTKNSGTEFEIECINYFGLFKIKKNIFRV